MYDLLSLASEYAFSKVPGWWPRAYLTLVLFSRFKDTNYAAFARMLRERASEVGIGKTTLYKGLNYLMREGFVVRKDGLYILTTKGFTLLQNYVSIEREIEEAAENRDRNTLVSLLRKVERLPGASEFEKYGKIYFTELINYLVETMTRIIEASMVNAVSSHKEA